MSSFKILEDYIIKLVWTSNDSKNKNIEDGDTFYKYGVGKRKVRRMVLDVRACAAN